MPRASLSKNFFLGDRVRIARTRKRITQLQLAKKLNLGDGQKVAAIEIGKRGLDFAELIRLAEVTEMPESFFTDPYILVCDEKYRFQTAGKVTTREQDNFAASMAPYLGTYRFLVNYFKIKAKKRAPKIDLRLPFNINSKAEYAVNAGEEIAALLQLGSKPIANLPAALARTLGIYPLTLDTGTPAIRAATLDLEEISFIIVNSRLTTSERSFALARELFHLLTWEALPYRKGVTPQNKLDKTDKLAATFSSSLLLPRQTIVEVESIGKKQTASRWVLVNAGDLGVSARALKVRLRQIKSERGRNLSSILDQLNLAELDNQIDAESTATPFSKQYVDLIVRALNEPLMTGKMALEKLACKDFVAATTLLHKYGIKVPAPLRPKSN